MQSVMMGCTAMGRKHVIRKPVVGRAVPPALMMETIVMVLKAVMRKLMRV